MRDQDKEQLKKELAGQIGERLRVRPSIELVPPYSLPRGSGKMPMIEIEKDG
jgi:phenylacetate-coenzyme A ligase PaaK-like adenylate-forming protein